ncbi:MAG: arsenate reductase ArsC [Promethearchaeota archaeon]|nr:MAG: arsenate reductase ArsC [Candidatus Lokiarchaeota archaeon]
MEKPNVIFLCTHNQARSQIAEAYLRNYGGENFNAFSAGFEKKEIHPFTKKVMKEKGIDLEKHYSKELKELMNEREFNIIVTVCSKAEELCPTLPGMESHIFWDIEDPVAFKGTEEEILNKFREVRDNLEEKIKEWLKSHEF